MAQTRKGAQLANARRLGLEIEEYLRLVESGKKRCRKCEAWIDRSLFGLDRSRGDGLASACRLCRNPNGARKAAKNRRKAKPVRDIPPGRLWCAACKKPHPEQEFWLNRKSKRGRAASCRAVMSQRERARRVRKHAAGIGRSFVPARDGDKKQARRRINYFVEAGIIPHPNTLPCIECRHNWTSGERRHEYHHHKGYAAEHHEDVVVVCTTCHRLEDGKNAEDND